MHFRLSRDADKPLREHFDELATRGTVLLFILSISTVIWWTQIDPVSYTHLTLPTTPYV